MTEMMSETLYNLRWEDHYHKIVLDSFWSLLTQETLTDCTLVCSPEESVQVHRLILSANSPYFRSLLSSHSAHPHPIIILHDVAYHTLKMLVTFMYRGSVNVTSDEMQLLLKTAENLQILGLSQTLKTETRKGYSPTESQVAVTTTTSHQVYSKKARILEQQSISSLYNNSNVNNVNNANNSNNVNNNTHNSPLNLLTNHLGGGNIPEQHSPLALRKKESISAPNTPSSVETSYYGNKFYSAPLTQQHHDEMRVNHSSGGRQYISEGEEDDEEVLHRQDLLSNKNFTTGDNRGEDIRHSDEEEDINDIHNDNNSRDMDQLSEDACGPISQTPCKSESPPPSHLTRFSCPYCTCSTFPSQSTLSRHIMVLHPSVYTSLYEDKEMDSKSGPHSPTHPNNPTTQSTHPTHPTTHPTTQSTHPVNNPTCSSSGVNTSSPGPTQTTTPSIVCKFCGKPFGEVSQLIQHLPIHTGERPFKCEFCGKAFKLRHHMKDHARVHTGERPFRCSLCGKTFSRSTILKAHEKTHFPKNEQVSPGASSNSKLL